LPVSEKSVHGVFIRKCFGGGVESLDLQIEQELASSKFKHVDKAEGKAKRYSLGSTAVINVNGQRYLLFALTTVDPITLKADADVTMMWIGLHDVWQRARNECNGERLNLPLIGHGLSNIGLPPRDLLNLIILSVITEPKANQI